MKIKVSNASGPVLDHLVAKREGKRDNDFGWWWDNFTPSSNPAQAYPIIVRERIQIQYDGIGCYSSCAETPQWRHRGETPLIAAMRCHVASKMGEVVDVPDHLA